ncbi:MAG TPA: Flp pilus assembly protein CpaB [Bryobacteraceae bacterium]|nr:Flp pilus assembly protein CpaB [Bryobacteraceae bacterium]
MDRRFLTVLAMSIVLALVVSAVFYQMSMRGSRQKPKQAEFRDLVMAAQPLPVGTTIRREELKITKVPSDLFPHGGFSKVEEVIDRPVVSNVLLDEPVLEGRLAARGSGLGLAPIIPPGMRAVSVRVNDVVGVAGFVLPGMRVDVLVTGRPPNFNGTITETVLQNIVVLSAGQVLQPESRGQAINTPVVTLLVTPEQAEILTLAGNEGRIQLVLRNGSDQASPKTPGRETRELYGYRTSKPDVPEKVAAPRPRPAVVRPVEAPKRPVVEEVVMIRGNQRTVEVVGVQKSPEGGN